MSRTFFFASALAVAGLLAAPVIGVAFDAPGVSAQAKSKRAKKTSSVKKKYQYQYVPNANSSRPGAWR